MARPLILSLDGQEIAVSLQKIDRDRIYGTIDIEAFDEKGNPATIKILAADGKTLIDKGGTSLATLDQAGNSVDRTELTPVNADGEKIDTVESSFNKPNVLKEATVEDYLSQMVKSVYVLQPFEESKLDVLIDHLSAKNIYSFPFSYRGGTENDSAFVIGNAGDAFMIVGKPADLEFVKLSQAAVLDSVEEQEISADDLDFDL